MQAIHRRSADYSTIPNSIIVFVPFVLRIAGRRLKPSDTRRWRIQMYLIEGRLVGVVAALVIAAAGVLLGGGMPSLDPRPGAAAAPVEAVSAEIAAQAATPCSQPARPPA
jgi:hypothetical protein